MQHPGASLRPFASCVAHSCAAKSSQVTSISVDFSRRTGYCRPRGAVDSGLAAVLAAVESVAVFVRVCRVCVVGFEHGFEWMVVTGFVRVIRVRCARVRPCVPCVPCVSRLPPVSLRHRGSRVCTRAKTGTPRHRASYTTIHVSYVSLFLSHEATIPLTLSFRAFIVSYCTGSV